LGDAKKSTQLGPSNKEGGGKEKGQLAHFRSKKRGGRKEGSLPSCIPKRHKGILRKEKIGGEKRRAVTGCADSLGTDSLGPSLATS